MSAVEAATWGLERTAVRKLLVGIAIATFLFLLPQPGGLSRAGMHTLILFALVVYFWATEALPLPVTALGAGVGLVLLRIAEEPNDAWGPYAQDTIFFILGSLILADAVHKTGTDRLLATRFLRRFGTSTDGLLFGIVAATALPAMFVSDHAVAAVMLTIVVSMLRATGLYERRNIAAAYSLAIALGASIAGIATPSGGARNAIVLGYLDELYDTRISYLDWAMRGVPVALVLIPVVFLVLKFTFKVPHETITSFNDTLRTERVTPAHKATLATLGGTVLLWIVLGERLGLGTIAIIGAVTTFVLGLLDWVDTRRRIAWGVPLIYGAALSMGASLQQTGAASWLADTLLGINPFDAGTALILAALVITVILTNFMSDGGTTAVVAPVSLALAALGGVSVTDMGMVTAMGSAFSFILVVGTPPNVIAYSSGLFAPKDLIRVGIPITIAALAILYFAVTVYWPMLP